MNKVFALYKKELHLYFATPTAYIFGMMFLVINGYFFWVILIDTKQATMRDTFSVMGSILLFVTPMLTMRLMAEERRSGTIELLFTSPLSTRSIVLGKFLAACSIYALMFIITLAYPIIITALGHPEFWPIVCGYFGLLFMAGCYTSVGLLASSLTENQLIAGITSFAILLAFLVIDWLKIYVQNTLWEDVIEHLSFFEHYDGLRKGIISTPDLVYFFSFIFIILFLTIHIIEIQRNQ